MMNSQEQQLQRALRTCAEQAIPDSADLWPRIRAQAAASQQPTRKIAIFSLRLQPISLLLLVILLMGVGCATGAAIHNMFFEGTFGMSGPVQAGLIHEVNQSQTINDVTVTIHGAYADARLLASGIAVRGEMGDDYFIRVGPVLINSSEVRGFSIIEPSGSFNLFDKAPNPNREARFSYKLGTTEDFSPAIAELTRIKPGDEPAMINVQLEIKVKQSHSDAQTELIGPFRFSFDMPIQPSHYIDVRQTSQDAGVAMTLEDVLITPSLMQTRLCFDPEGMSDGWETSIIAERPDGRRIEASVTDTPDSGCVAHIFYGAPLAGTWTLTIDQLKSDTKTIDGSWSFQFDVPELNP